MCHDYYIPTSVQQPLRHNLKEKLGVPEDHPAMHRVIDKGFEFDIVVSIANETGLSQTEILNALNLPHWKAVKKRKHRYFTSAESNRIYALIEALSAAEDLFEGAICDAINWIKKPCRQLGQRSPLENLNSFFELQQVLSFIRRLEYGVFS